MSKFDGVYLNIGGREVLSTEISYSDLVDLYHIFIDTYGRIPTDKDCKSSNNLPQPRIVKRLVESEGLLFKDFLSQFGKRLRVRTNDVENYDFYVSRFINLCKENGKALTSKEVNAGNYGLPGFKWLIENCPDKTANNYAKFLDYCGMTPSKHIFSKEEVVQKLIEYEDKLGRPIKRDDIKTDSVGFSMIVINRIFGGLGSAKQAIGLKRTPPKSHHTYSFYRSALSDIVAAYISNTGKKYITWKDIENKTYNINGITRKTFLKSFSDNNEDLFEFVRKCGCSMNPSTFAFTYTFDDGEKVDSNMEYEVSLYLRKIGMRYKDDYSRMVKYSDFTNHKSRMTCDYSIKINEEPHYVEVLGMISSFSGNWRTHNYPSKIENEYRDKMILKEKILNEEKVKYLFIFADDMQSNRYTGMIDSFIQ